MVKVRIGFWRQGQSKNSQGQSKNLKVKVRIPQGKNWQGQSKSHQVRIQYRILTLGQSKNSQGENSIQNSYLRSK